MVDWIEYKENGNVVSLINRQWLLKSENQKLIKERFGKDGEELIKQACVVSK